MRVWTQVTTKVFLDLTLSYVHWWIPHQQGWEGTMEACSIQIPSPRPLLSSEWRLIHFDPAKKRDRLQAIRNYWKIIRLRQDRNLGYDRHLRT